MDSYSKSFNIYCDESSVDGDKLHRYFVIGALIIPRNKKVELKNNLEELKKKHSISEIKWNNLSDASLKLAQSILKLFFKIEYISFNAIVVDKNKVNYEFYHEGSKELAFYKFYYFLLRNRLLNECRYYIFLDKKPVSVQNRVSVLKAFLTGFIKSSRQDCVIKHLQEYSSSENLLIQVSDLLTGAVASKFNFGDKLKSKSKKNVIKAIEKSIGRKINTPTSYSEKKFNIFYWQPKDNENKS